MKDKEFRKLRREDLIEIIYQYQRREQLLVKENEGLRRRAEDRSLKLQNAGSIAEAALALSGVFEAAQKAADLYISEVKKANPIEKREEDTQPAGSSLSRKEMPKAEHPAAPAAENGTAANASKRETPARTLPGAEAPAAVAGKTHTSAKTADAAPARPTAKAAAASKPAAGESAAGASKIKSAVPAREPKPIRKPERPPAVRAAKPAAKRPEVSEEDTDQWLAELKELIGG